MRRAGLALAAALGVCLLAVVVAMAGGPQAPFTQWAAPKPPAGSTQVGTGAARRPARAGTQTPSPSVQVSPRPGASPTPSASSTASATLTNPAGRTPSGLTRSPNPHKSSHGP
jgi:hypothetical protein